MYVVSVTFKKVSNKIEELLLAYLDISLKIPPNIAVSTELRHAQMLCSICIDYCQSTAFTRGSTSNSISAIGRTDLLFDEIFNRFRKVGLNGVFLEHLEPYILNDKLISLNPEIMQAFVNHYSKQSEEMLQRVEQCILHLDILSLDFHQVLVYIRDQF